MDESVSRLDLGDVLDLHHFNPRDVEIVLEEFLRDAFEKRKASVKIIHGKGMSRVKARVARYLEGCEWVAGFSDDGGNWGATLVKLKTAVR